MRSFCSPFDFDFIDIVHLFFHAGFAYSVRDVFPICAWRIIHKLTAYFGAPAIRADNLDAVRVVLRVRAVPVCHYALALALSLIVNHLKPLSLSCLRWFCAIKKPNTAAIPTSPTALTANARPDIAAS
jgi:hypothetical protein